MHRSRGRASGEEVSKGKGLSVGKLGQRMCPNQTYIAVCSYVCHVITVTLDASYRLVQDGLILEILLKLVH